MSFMSCKLLHFVYLSYILWRNGGGCSLTLNISYYCAAPSQFHRPDFIKSINLNVKLSF